MATARGRWTRSAPQPEGRTPPFVLVRDEGDEADVLIAPFAIRPSGPTAAEVESVKAVASRLVRDLPAGSYWIAQDGTATRAMIEPGQLRRRLTDCASFDVRC
jgi:hypothetical protein